MSSVDDSFKCRSLLTLIIDVTPSSWGEREGHRSLQDELRKKAGKRSIGPATLEEVLLSLLSFSLAFAALHRENSLVVIGVADSEVYVIYPRENESIDEIVTLESRELGESVVKPHELYECLMLGVGKIVEKSSKKAEDRAAQTELLTSKNDEKPLNLNVIGAAVTAATSMALCIIHRFIVAVNGNMSYCDCVWGGFQHKIKDENVASKFLTTGRYPSVQVGNNGYKRGTLSPRILIVQVCEDRTQDYNSFMNCVFAAIEENIVIDGCFIPSGIANRARTSIFLEQACDRTGGVFSKPTGFSQVSGGLTEVLMTVFLPPLTVRRWLNLPKLNKVDFRARCFKTGQSINQGYVCNRCLSIFETCPKEFCLTCGAKIKHKRSKEIQISE